MSTVARRVAAPVAVALGMSAWTPYAAGLSAEPVDFGGQAVSSSTDSRRPTVLEAGLWTTELGPQSQPQYYTYERQIKDSTVHVGVVGAPQTPESDGLSILTTVPTPEDAAGVECGTDDGPSESSTPHGLVGAEVIVGEEEGDTGTACRGADDVRVVLSRYSSSSTGDLPIAIKIVEEAPVTDAGDPPAESEELDYRVPEPTDPATGPDGAASFDDAPLVDPHEGPVTIATEVTEGTELLWQVPLDWGDQLVVRGDLPAVAGEDPLAGVVVQLHLVQPSRDVYGLSAGEDYTYDYFDEDGARMVAASYPLRFSNRLGGLEPTLPGDHWVAVSVRPAPEERQPLAAPIELTFEVTATETTAPTYQDAVLAQGGGSGPGGYAPDTPYLVGAGEFAAVASGNPFEPNSQDDSWWQARRIAGLGLGLVSLACCAAGAVWLVRARRS